jgi:hypothetical protein
MKFPINHCVPTEYLTKEKYDWILTRLISDGYHWPSNFSKSLFFDLWKYIGCNSQGDIQLYDEPVHYLPVGVEEYNNVLNEMWLEEYLK